MNKQNDLSTLAKDLATRISYLETKLALAERELESITSVAEDSDRFGLRLSLNFVLELARVSATVETIKGQLHELKWTAKELSTLAA